MAQYAKEFNINANESLKNLTICTSTRYSCQIVTLFIQYLTINVKINYFCVKISFKG
nr:MAG TPA: hypothetical protein [Caudoviricetes sp.]